LETWVSAMADATQKGPQRHLRKRLAKRTKPRLEIPGDQPKKGGILAALRRSPLVGADLNLARTGGTDG
jgi:hypothetical protein